MHNHAATAPLAHVGGGKAEPLVTFPCAKCGTRDGTDGVCKPMCNEGKCNTVGIEAGNGIGLLKGSLHDALFRVLRSEHKTNRQQTADFRLLAETLATEKNASLADALAPALGAALFHGANTALLRRILPLLRGTDACLCGNLRDDWLNYMESRLEVLLASIGAKCEPDTVIQLQHVATTLCNFDAGRAVLGKLSESVCAVLSTTISSFTQPSCERSVSDPSFGRTSSTIVCAAFKALFSLPRYSCNSEVFGNLLFSCRSTLTCSRFPLETLRLAAIMPFRAAIQDPGRCSFKQMCAILSALLHNNGVNEASLNELEPAKCVATIDDLCNALVKEADTLLGSTASEQAFRLHKLLALVLALRAFLHISVSLNSNVSLDYIASFVEILVKAGMASPACHSRHIIVLEGIDYCCNALLNSCRNAENEKAPDILRVPSVPAKFLNTVLPSALDYTLSDVSETPSVLVKQVAGRILQTLFAHAGDAKSAMSYISHLEKKSKIQYRVLTHFVNHFGPNALLETKPKVLKHAFESIDSRSVTSQIIDFLVSVYKNVKENAGITKQWVLEEYAKRVTSNLIESKEQKLCEFTIQYALQQLLRDCKGLAELLEIKIKIASADPSFDMQKVLNARVAVHRALLSSATGFDLELSKSLKTDLLAAAQHPSVALRLEVLAFLAESQKVTIPIDAGRLDVVKTIIFYNMADSSTEFRKKMLSYLSKIFVRIRESSYNLFKHKNNQNLISKNVSLQFKSTKSEKANISAEFVDGQLKIYVELLSWTISWCCANLKTGCTFARGFTCVSMLLNLVKIFGPSAEHATMPTGFCSAHCDPPRFPYSLPFKQSGCIDAMIDVVCNNPFMLLKDLAREFLDATCLLTSGIEYSNSLASRAHSILASARGHNIDAGAFLLDLSFCAAEKCPKTLAQCFSNILQVIHLQANEITNIEKIALHGHLVGCLRAVRFFVARYPKMESSELSAKNAMALFKAIYLQISTLISSSAPEGKIPVGQQSSTSATIDDENLFSSRSQRVMSFSWRVVKEFCDLLSSSWGSDAQNIAFYDECSKFFIKLLFELRHRGAFMAVFPNLRKVISSANKYDPGFASDALQSVLERVVASSHALTRRSGGAPYALLAILQAHGVEAVGLTTDAVDFLFSRVKKTHDNVPASVQSNCLNVLRMMVIDGTVATYMQASFERCYLLAIAKFGHPEWCVRNSALMLFSAITTRVFETGNVKRDGSAVLGITCAQFEARFPVLFQLLSSLLSKSLGDCASEISTECPDLDAKRRNLQYSSIFPLIALVSHFAPVRSSEAHQTASAAAKLRVSVKNYLAVKDWKVREMAATAFSRLLPPTQVLKEIKTGITEIQKLLKFTGSQRNENLIHGLLLSITAMTSGLCKLDIDDRSESLKDLCALLVSLPATLEKQSCSQYLIYASLCALERAIQCCMVSKSELGDEAELTLRQVTANNAGLPGCDLVISKSLEISTRLLDDACLEKVVLEAQSSLFLVRMAAFNILSTKCPSFWLTSGNIENEAASRTIEYLLSACAKRNLGPDEVVAMLKVRVKWNLYSKEFTESLLLEFDNKVASPGLKCVLLELMAKGFAQDPTDSAAVCAKILSVLRACADPVEPLDLRTAAMRALVAVAKSADYDLKQKLLWLCATTLLQDDDTVLRECTAIELQKVLGTDSHSRIQHSQALLVHLIANYFDKNVLESEMKKCTNAQQQQVTTSPCDPKKTEDDGAAEEDVEAEEEEILFEHEQANSYKDGILQEMMLKYKFHEMHMGCSTESKELLKWFV